MPKFLTESILIKLVMGFVNVFINAYNESGLKKFVSKIGVCFKNSVFYKVVAAYGNKKPWFRYSLVYRFAMLVAKIIDKIFGGVYSLVKKCLFGSGVAREYCNMANMSLDKKCCGMGVLLIGVAIGSIIAVFVFSHSLINIIISVAVLVLGVVLLILSKYGENSVLIKLIKGFITAVK